MAKKKSKHLTLQDLLDLIASVGIRFDQVDKDNGGQVIIYTGFRKGPDGKLYHIGEEDDDGEFECGEPLLLED